MRLTDSIVFRVLIHVNTVPVYDIFDLSKLRAFADDKISLTQNLKFVSEIVENIVGKG